MNLKNFLFNVVQTLKKEQVRYALAGGLIASLYRTEERLTKDLDFLIFAESHTQQTATHIIQSLHLTPHIIRKADLEKGPLFAIKRKSTPPYMIVGRSEKEKTAIGLDFILPAMPWFEPALDRAEQNNVDFGFGAFPCLTVEDIILAKFFSYQNDQTRFNDLDDLKSIFLANHTLDLAYLSGQMQKLGLVTPKLIDEIAPQAIKIISKKIRKKKI